MQMKKLLQQEKKTKQKQLIQTMRNGLFCPKTKDE